MQPPNLCDLLEECRGFNEISDYENGSTASQGTIDNIWVLEPHPCRQHTTITTQLTIVNIYRVHQNTTFLQRLLLFQDCVPLSVSAQEQRSRRAPAQLTSIRYSPAQMI